MLAVFLLCPHSVRICTLLLRNLQRMHTYMSHTQNIHFTYTIHLNFSQAIPICSRAFFRVGGFATTQDSPCSFVRDSCVVSSASTLWSENLQSKHCTSHLCKSQVILHTRHAFRYTPDNQPPLLSSCAVCHCLASACLGR